MNELLEQYMNEIVAYLKSGSAWIKAELPHYIEELIKYKTMTAWLYIIVSAVMLLVLIAWTIRVLADNAYGDETFAYAGISLFMYPGTLICIVYNISVLIKLSVAPRVFLLDYVTSLL